MKVEYVKELNAICVRDGETATTIPVTLQALEAVAEYFYNNYGSYENQNGRINYEYKY
ncbi:hypothetical protein [Paenibacillus cremeus]|uniref:hypothetical protein n=1 Tax=Paenibacillus cremeus TaxID=2163881 RepID=UPI001C978017|nr:hypothetical protein [Paenibacillus cremeus]